jgi:hypothetical protein
MVRHCKWCRCQPTREVSSHRAVFWAKSSTQCQVYSTYHPCPMKQENSGRTVENLLLEAGDHRVFLAATQRQRRSVEALIHRMYSWRGYGVGIAALPAYRRNDAVLQVCRGTQTVGTIAVRFDSPAGLLADGLYRKEIDGIREFGGEVCELTGLAISPGEDTAAILNAMFRAAYILGSDYCVNHVVVEVNPRHSAHYRRLLGFRLAGPERICSRVGAPAVLLHLELDSLGALGSDGLRRAAAATTTKRRGCPSHQPYRPFIRFAAVTRRGGDQPTSRLPASRA